MSAWERIDANGQAHALNQKEDKRARQKFAALMDARDRRAKWDSDKRDDIDEEPDHLSVGTRRDGGGVRLIGMARDLHGADGVCTCCTRGGAL